MKTSYYLNGHKILILLTATTKQEVDQKHCHYFNHGSTDADEAHTIEDLVGQYSGCFWTSVAKFKKGLVNINLFRLLNNAEKFKGRQNGAMDVAKQMAEIEFDSFEKLDYNPREIENMYVEAYRFGTMEAEKPDFYSDDKD